jgi:hypothetical protein
LETSFHWGFLDGGLVGLCIGDGHGLGVSVGARGFTIDPRIAKNSRTTRSSVPLRQYFEIVALSWIPSEATERVFSARSARHPMPNFFLKKET